MTRLPLARADANDSSKDPVRSAEAQSLLRLAALQAPPQSSAQVVLLGLERGKCSLAVWAA